MFAVSPIAQKRRSEIIAFKAKNLTFLDFATKKYSQK